MPANPEKKADIGFAKQVDRLFWITDDEERAAVAALPSGYQPVQQFILGIGGILEFIDQDVTDRVVEFEQQVTRIVGCSQAGQGGAGHLGKIDGAGLAKNRAQLDNDQG